MTTTEPRTNNALKARTHAPHITPANQGRRRNGGGGGGGKEHQTFNWRACRDESLQGQNNVCHVYHSGRRNAIDYSPAVPVLLSRVGLWNVRTRCWPTQCGQRTRVYICMTNLVPLLLATPLPLLARTPMAVFLTSRPWLTHRYVLCCDTAARAVETVPCNNSA